MFDVALIRNVSNSNNNKAVGIINNSRNSKETVVDHQRIMEQLPPKQQRKQSLKQHINYDYTSSNNGIDGNNDSSSS